MPAWFSASADGPITVSVTHDDQTVVANDQVQVETELTLTSITPSVGGPGTQATITGSGFFPDNRAVNQVTFEGDNGARLGATVISATEDTLIVRVPPGTETGDVIVSILSEVSNPLNFEVLINEVIIDFGDNGAANDDTFALFVDGDLIHSMPSPTRSAGPFTLDLAPGDHTVALRGITAPDAIGTFFISISGNVSGITGPSRSGSDLTAGVQKNWVITVSSGAANQVNSAFAPIPAGESIPIIWKEDLPK